MKREFIADKEALHSRVIAAYKYAKELIAAVNGEKGIRITIDYYTPTRSLEQNDKMWAMLTDISNQVEWPVDGVKKKLIPDDWKDIISSGLQSSTRVAAGIEGGFVMLGKRTSKFTIDQMARMIELCQFFGDREGVVWSEPKAKGQHEQAS